ncbi:MAG: hypothetical protein GX455_13010, partial [Phycisphaerae bacterium]|nr:hypothetical protein [Phycisphaerae bacterium]
DSTPTTVAEFVYDALGRRINLEYCPLRAQTQPAGQSLGLTGRQTALHPGPSTIP